MADNATSDSLETAKKLVDELYEYRDHYVERFGMEKVTQKADDLDGKMRETLVKLDEMKDTIKNKAEYFLLRGRTLNVVGKFSNEALETLSKAVKLDPKSVEAWNHLGECYWKNSDMAGAKNCFSGALGHEKNKVSLRNLSMVMRQLRGSPDERQQLIKDSVEKAKEAVQLDISDGTSWLILGNAYLSLFFSGGQDPKVLKQCMSAYSQAERDLVAKSNPDLSFNRAMSYKYQEEYQQALEGFHTASQLDPSWTDPLTEEKALLTYLDNIVTLTEKRGKLKPKKLNAYLNSLSVKDFGPYAGGSYTSPHGQTIELAPIPTTDLAPEVNSNKVICGKVVCSVESNSTVPFTFCLSDKKGCVAVTVYNMVQGGGVKIGDSVAIPEPFGQKVQVKHKDKTYDFLSVRVDSPLVMVVNGNKVRASKQAASVLSVRTVPE
ncbi:tetratricopeptide repeat protein 5-like isoform X2 [Littorina saxatilis]|uniref:Tetratricopeptide repeat protein 5 OB fold domain-containing protein n=1 Tax=Littorina saxatilis TaxID=31220 RepID=A0AAN9BZQ2_9CAEN